jgi:transcription elongation factor GreA
MVRSEQRITLWYYRPAMAESMKDRLIRKFEDEIQTLNHELKLELPKEIRRARELGDLRENAEYAAAKERQRLVEARISMLQKRVSEIALINIDRIPKDRAGFGSTVHVIEGNGEKLVFQLVMPEDADAAKGLISTTSPIGRAFLNKEQGDNVHVTTPGGTREFEIVKLLTIHDEAE